MPSKTDLLSMPVASLALCCAERCALMEACGEGTCFQLDWLDDLYGTAHAHHDSPDLAPTNRTRGHVT